MVASRKDASTHAVSISYRVGTSMLAQYMKQYGFLAMMITDDEYKEMDNEK